MRKIYSLTGILAFLTVLISCSKKSDFSTNADVTKEWSFTISSSGENLATTGKEVTAVFHMLTLANNSLNYDVQVDSVGDNIVSAQIRLGDPVTDGPLLVDLPVRVYSTYASGILTGLRQSLIDTLSNDNIDKYINIASVKAPMGLVRGSLNLPIVLSKNVQLTGGAVVPAVTTSAKGTAFIRLANNNVLYSKIVVTNDPADPVTTASINSGVSTANGPVILTLASSAADFGIAKKTSITSTVYSSLVANSTYIIAGSANNPAGKIRGQLK